MLHSRWTNVHFMGKWRQGLKIDLWGNKAVDSTFWPCTRILPSSAILFKKKFAKSAFFHNFASFQVNKCPFYGKWRQGLKIDLGSTKQRTALFNLVQEFYPARPSSSRKNSLSLHFFTILPHSRWTYIHFMENGHRGLNPTWWQQSSGQYPLTSHKKITELSHPLQDKFR